MPTLPLCRPLPAVAAAVLTGSVLLAGCTGSAPRAATGPAVATTQSQSQAQAQSQADDSSSSAPAQSPVAVKPSASKTPSRTPTPSISIPPNLCAATDIAQNTADAYMGALSAGDEKEALDCVFPRTVPLATTQSLLAKVKNTAVYLPKQGGADGPSNFDYVGNGKTITVTVTRQADHKTWVTKVALR